jgi:hypothetical protein
MDTEKTEALELMAAFMQQNAKFSSDLTNSLMESYEFAQIRTEVELYLVRQRMNKLLDSDYMPSQDAMYKALYPPQSLIDYQAQERFDELKSARGEK